MSSYANCTAEDYNRLRKAIKLADVITLSGLTSEQMSGAAAGDAFWKVASQGAFPDEPKYLPRQETRDVVIRLLVDRENTAKRLFDMAEAAQNKEKAV